MKKVLTVGVFDYFHIGHLRLFKQCKEHGDYLIVAVQEDDIIKKYRIVDEVTTYRAIDEDIKNHDFDIFAVGEDQNHDGFKRAIEWCENHNKQVVTLKRTPNICSSQIKSELRK